MSESATWRVSRPTDTGRHCYTHRVKLQGKSYKLDPADIELDGDTLGHGAGGIVQKGVHKPTGTPVAIKTIKVDAKAKKEQMLNEIKGLINAIGCPQLVQWWGGDLNMDLLDAIADSRSWIKQSAAVRSWCSGGT